MPVARLLARRGSPPRGFSVPRGPKAAQLKMILISALAVVRVPDHLPVQELSLPACGSIPPSIPRVASPRVHAPGAVGGTVSHSRPHASTSHTSGMILRQKCPKCPH
jgi:hypothetical protein